MPTYAEDNPFPYITLVETADPSTPTANTKRVWLDTDGVLKVIDEAAAVTDWQGSGGLTDPMSARGDIIVRNASNVTDRLAVGSAGKVLSSDGTDVSWQTPASSGALVLLEQHTASSSSSLDFTSFISSTYDTYRLEGVALVLQTSGADLYVEMGTGGGPTWDTGNSYEWSAFLQSSDGVTTGRGDSGSTGIARIFRAISVTAGYGFGTFSVTATSLQSTAIRKTLHGTVEFVNTAPAACYGFWGMQWTTTGTAVTGIRFIPSSGNIVSGTIRVYGIAK